MEQYWSSTQHHIEQALRKRDRRHGSDDQTSQHEIRRRRNEVNKQVADQRKLAADLMRIDNRLQVGSAAQVSDDDDVLAHFEWARENCVGKAGCIDVSEALATMLRHILNTKRPSQTEVERLASLRAELRSMTEVIGTLPNGDSAVQDAASAIQRLAGVVESIDHVVDSRREMYALARATMMMQGILQADEARYIEFGSRSEDRVPAPTLAMAKAYEKWHNELQERQTKHDTDNYDDFYTEMRMSRPDIGEPEVAELWFQESNNHAANLRMVEDKFVAVRDAYMAAGGNPLKLSYRYERGVRGFAEFAGQHPDDGRTEPLASADEAARLEYTTQRVVPDVWRWLDSAHFTADPGRLQSPARMTDLEGFSRLTARCQRHGDAEDLEPRPNIDETEYQSLIDARDRPASQRSVIAPWDSGSQQDRTPYIKTCIEGRKAGERSPDVSDESYSEAGEHT